jgi:hypothetical protein
MPASAGFEHGFPLGLSRDLDGGVDELADGGSSVASPPGDCELTGAEVEDGAVDESRPRVDGGVSFGEEHDAVAGGNTLEGFVGACRLSSDAGGGLGRSSA